MTDDRWKQLLPLLRQQEPIAQGEMLSIYYDYVFATLLQLACWQNSAAGAPIPDPELRDLVHELTGEAFVSAFSRIDGYDPDKAALPTWIVSDTQAIAAPKIIPHKTKLSCTRRRAAIARNCHWPALGSGSCR